MNWRCRWFGHKRRHLFSKQWEDYAFSTWCIRCGEVWKGMKMPKAPPMPPVTPPIMCSCKSELACEGLSTLFIKCKAVNEALRLRR